MWCVPDVKKNLIFIGQLVEKDMDVLFNKYGWTITSSNTGEELVTRRKVGRTFILNDTKKKCMIANEKKMSLTCDIKDWDMWVQKDC